MGDQCETFCFDWASLEPVYLNTLEMPFLELVLVCPPTVESLVDVLVSAKQEEPVTSPRVGKGQPEVESDKNRCEELARDGDGLGEVWRDRGGGKGQRRCGGTRRVMQRWGGTGRVKKRLGGTGRGGKGQGEVSRDRER